MSVKSELQRTNEQKQTPDARSTALERHAGQRQILRPNRSTRRADSCGLSTEELIEDGLSLVVQMKVPQRKGACGLN